jgi:hypothetical protein
MKIRSNNNKCIKNHNTAAASQKFLVKSLAAENRLPNSWWFIGIF